MSVCRYLSTNLRCKILFGEKIVMNCVFYSVFFSMSSIRPHGTVNVTFFRGITAGLNVLSGVEAINDSVLTLLYFQQERKLLLVSKTGI